MKTILSLQKLEKFKNFLVCLTYTQVGREALCSVAGKFTDNLEVVKLGLEPREKLLAVGHQVGVELQEVSQ